jgi:hypothetical protein
MTLELIKFNDNQLIYFHTKERNYLNLLAARANLLLDKIIKKTATKDEDQEYHALKWILKEVGSIDKEYLQRVKR